MINIADIPKKEILKGMVAQFVHTDNTTLGFWEIEKGAILPNHSHFHEQITQVLEGEFELSVGDEILTLQKGQLVVIPPNTIHGGKAITNCKIFDIFSPVREDYKV